MGMAVAPMRLAYQTHSTTQVINQMQQQVSQCHEAIHQVDRNALHYCFAGIQWCRQRVAGHALQHGALVGQHMHGGGPLLAPGVPKQLRTGVIQRLQASQIPLRHP
jgi:hypothetical protein